VTLAFRGLRARPDPGPPAQAPETPQAARQEAAPAQPAAPAVPAPKPGLGAAMAHGFRSARRGMARRDGHWVTEALGGHAPSVNDQRAYLANRGWLPPGHEGGIADRIGEAYQVAVAIPGVAAGLAWAWLVSRQFRFTWALATGPVALFAVLRLLRAPARTAVLVAFGPALAVVAWVALVAGLLALRRAWHGRRNPKEN
jgi:hypothetical protein